MRIVWAFILSLRPQQWVKNVFVFAPAIFSLHLFNGLYMARALLAFLLFSLASGAIYLINDVVDKPRDQLHPEKRNRPIAAGRLPILPALAGAVILLVIVLSASWTLRREFFFICLTYCLLNVLYSLFLKAIVILDIMVIAIGFVLRVMAGGSVDRIPVSPWILIATFLLSIFLALIKRRQELLIMGTGGHEESTRKTLQEYNLPFLDQMISVATAATLIAYIMYVLSPGIQAKFSSENLYFTVPFVVFGIFRYLYLTYTRGRGENPAEVIYTDLPFTLNLILWVAVFILLVFHQP